MITAQTFWTQNHMQFSQDTLQAMRDWVKECFECSLSASFNDFEDLEMTDAQVIRYVKKNYDGGIAGFLAAL